MKFEFAKYTEITDFAFRIMPELKENGYIRMFICPDSNNYWLQRILKGFDEEYEKDDDSYILERQMLPMDRKGERLSINKLKKLLLEDDGGNYDYKQSYEIEELIKMVDGGFGILNLNEQ